MSDETPMIGESRRAAKRDARRAERDRLVREALMAGAGPLLAQEAVSSTQMSHDDVGTHEIPEGWTATPLGTFTVTPKEDPRG